MTRDHMPIISCDGDDGSCYQVSTDFYESLADSVNGIRMTSTQRAPGWTSSGDEDFCPEHTPTNSTKPENNNV